MRPRDLIIDGACMARAAERLSAREQGALLASILLHYAEARPGGWSLDLGEHYAAVSATMTDGYFLARFEVVPWAAFPTEVAACRARGLCSNESMRVALARRSREQALARGPAG